MSTFKRLTKVFESSEEILFRHSSKIVLFSDIHRGDGSWADDFGHNQSIYFSALKHYYKKGFTYIELGDGDELWKNKYFSDITTIYAHVFELLHKFYRNGRLYMIYGNHDIVKRDPVFLKDNMHRYFNEYTGEYEPLFEDIKIHEGLILRHMESNTKIFLVHGHQGDPINDQFWWLGRFLVRHVWRRLELLAFRDPTSAAKNYRKKYMVERKVAEWAEKNNQIVIAGHTHRPMLPDSNKLLYFNDGCCVHPNCITAMEIVNSEILLVKWFVKSNDDGLLFVEREVIASPWKLKSMISV